jgi:hypothetical protein
LAITSGTLVAVAVVVAVDVVPGVGGWEGEEGHRTPCNLEEGSNRTIGKAEGKQ